MPRRPPSKKSRAVAITLAGCDFGTSGVSIFAQALVPRLVESLSSRGLRTVVLGTARERAAVGLANAPGMVLPAAFDAPGPSAAFSLAGVTLAARALGADVVYLPCANRRIVGLAALPVVGTVHDLAQFHVPQKYGALRQVYVQRVLVPLLRALRIVTTVSRATADDVVKYAGVAESRVRVIPNGVSLGAASQTPAEPPARPFLFYPARLEHPGKNHLRLLDAFATASCRSTHDLVFSGADWGAEAALRARIQELGLAEQVRLLGFIPRDAFAETLGQCDAVIAAGLCEGFGLPAAEALACGKVVAASNTGSLPEVIGPLGALFDPLDVGSIARALDRAVSDTALRARCRLEGPTRAATFSWDEAAAKTASALVEALDVAA